VHLNAPVFYENLRALARRSAATAGVIALPWGPETTTIPMVAAEDVARVAVGALTGPVMPNGTVLPLVGSVVTIGEIADAFGEALYRPVRYQEITDEQWIGNVSGAGLNPAALEHLTHLWRHLRTRPPEQQATYQVSDIFKRVGGVEPTSLQRFLFEQRDALLEPSG
jgi:uncharacterized protein YbjT (DUF2867 family)